MKHEELYEHPILLSIVDKEQAFLVPDNYFESLADKILAQVQPIETEAAASLLPPDDYFDSFYSIVQEKIEKTTEQELAPLLFSISKPAPLEAPTGYFEEFEKQVLNNIAPPLPQRVSLWRKVRVAVLASAACLVFLWGGNQWLNNHSVKQSLPAETVSFSTLSNEELLEALEKEDIEMSVLVSELHQEQADEPILDNVSDEELLDYLEEI